MKVVQTKRNKGKTTKMVELLLENPDAILLVANELAAERVIAEYGIPNGKKRVFSWRNYPKTAIRDNAILIDNADLYLQEEFIFSILGVSINED